MAKHGDAMGLAGALAQDQSLANAVDEQGVSALLWAQYHGHPEAARILRQARASLSVFEAAALGDVHVLRDQMAADPAIVNSVSPDGFSPLGLAAFFGHFEAAMTLAEAGGDLNRLSTNPIGAAPMHSALAMGHVELARKFVELGANVNLAAKGGWTALHYAADLGDVALAKWLMEHGATHGYRNDQGKTAAEHAEEVGHTEVLHYFQHHAGA